MPGRRKYVYFGEIPGTDTIKIGMSMNPIFRCYLQNLKIVGIMSNARFKEARLHVQFSHIRASRRDVFLDCEELRLYIFRSNAHSNLWTWQVS